MDIREYLKHGDRQRFARSLDVSDSLVDKLARGQYLVSVELAIRIETVTHGVVRACELRPDVDWPRPPSLRAS